MILLTHSVTRNLIIGLTGMALCGCLPQPLPDTAAQSSSAVSHPQITEDCILRQLAFDMTLRQKGIEEPSILAGCEGPHKGYIVSQRERERIKLADQNPPPEKVVLRGLGHEKLYQQLKARGVPNDILLQIIDTREYDAAAAKVPTQRVM